MSPSEATKDPQALLERSLALKAFPPLSSLNERVLSTLALHAHTRRLGAGERLTADQPSARALRLVTVGVLRSPDGNERFGRHQVVGGPQALALRSSEAALIAEGDVVLLEFEDRVLEALFEDEFSVLEAILRGLARGLLEHFGADVSLELPHFAGPMGLIERIQLLRCCPGLNTLGLDILADLGLEGEVLRLDAGSSWESTDSETYAALLEGTLVDPSGKAIDAPAMIGWLAVLAEQAHSAPYLARTSSELMVFTAERLWDRLEDHPERGLALVRALARMHGETTDA